MQQEMHHPVASTMRVSAPIPPSPSLEDTHMNDNEYPSVNSTRGDSRTFLGPSPSSSGSSSSSPSTAKKQGVHHHTLPPAPPRMPGSGGSGSGGGRNKHSHNQHHHHRPPPPSHSLHQHHAPHPHHSYGLTTNTTGTNTTLFNVHHKLIDDSTEAATSTTIVSHTTSTTLAATTTTTAPAMTTTRREVPLWHNAWHDGNEHTDGHTDESVLDLVNYRGVLCYCHTMMNDNDSTMLDLSSSPPLPSTSPPLTSISTTSSVSGVTGNYSEPNANDDGTIVIPDPDELAALHAAYSRGESITTRNHTARCRLVVIKSHIKQHATPETIARLQFALLIRSKLYTASAPHHHPNEFMPHARRMPDNRYCVVMSDPGGDVLKALIQRENTQMSPQHPFTRARIERSLQWCIDIAKALQEFHNLPMSHRNLNPTTILLNTLTHEVLFLGLTSSSRQQGDKVDPNQSIYSYTPYEWLYLSPEQSGKANRAIDQRSDLYSIGIIFYKLLTGHPPFESNDVLSIVHMHLARAPPPIVPSEMTPSTDPDLFYPLTIAASIAMKLLQKQSEDRYQSTAGLIHDLSALLQLMKNEDANSVTGTPVATASPITPLSTAVASTSQFQRQSIEAMYNSFHVGETDDYSQFRLSQRLYNRDNDVATLLQAYDLMEKYDSEGSNSKMNGHDAIGGSPSIPTVSTTPPTLDQRGGSHFYLIHGDAGIGKSSMLDELHKHVVRRRGLFARTRYELMKHDLSCLFQAFHSLMIHLLVSDSMKWRTKLLTALGENSRLIIDVVPELTRVIGTHHPEVIKLSTQDTITRFHHVFTLFLSALCAPSTPLTLFIDDLHWADATSLNLLFYLLQHGPSHLLIIATARPVEIPHPLSTFLTEAQQDKQIKLNEMILKPLETSHLVTLLTDSFRCTFDEAQPLSQILKIATDGSPFFVNTMIRRWFTEGLLAFNFTSCRWEWKLQSIRASTIRSDVVEVIYRQMLTLSEAAQTLLQYSASFSPTSFDLYALLQITQLPLRTLLDATRECEHAGLIVCLSNAHDFILLQAAATEGTRTTSSKSSADATPSASHKHISSGGTITTNTNNNVGTSRNNNNNPTASPTASSSIHSTPSQSQLQGIVFRFSYDRIQVAALRLIPLDASSHVHSMIARQLLVSSSVSDESGAIGIVQHLNTGYDILHSEPYTLYSSSTSAPASYDPETLPSSSTEERQQWETFLFDSHHGLLERVISLEFSAAKQLKQQANANAYEQAIKCLTAILKLLERQIAIKSQGSVAASVNQQQDVQMTVAQFPQQQQRSSPVTPTLNLRLTPPLPSYPTSTPSYPTSSSAASSPSHTLAFLQVSAQVWLSYYYICLRAYDELCHCLFLCSNYIECDAAVRYVFTHVTSIPDRSRFYVRHLQTLNRSQRMQESLDIGYGYLKSLGVELLQNLSEETEEWVNRCSSVNGTGMNETDEQSLYAQHPVFSLPEHPAPLVMTVLSALTPAIFTLCPSQLLPLSATLLEETRTRGISCDAAFAFTLRGIVNWMDYEKNYVYARIASMILQRYQSAVPSAPAMTVIAASPPPTSTLSPNNTTSTSSSTSSPSSTSSSCTPSEFDQIQTVSTRCNSLIFGLIYPWIQNFHQNMRQLEYLLETSLNDYEWMNGILIQLSERPLVCNLSLSVSRQKLAYYRELAMNRSLSAQDTLSIYSQLIDHLMCIDSIPTVLQLPRDHLTSIMHISHLLAHGIGMYYSHHPQEAIQSLRKVISVYQNQPGYITRILHIFYLSLALTDSCPRSYILLKGVHTIQTQLNEQYNAAGVNEVLEEVDQYIAVMEEWVQMASSSSLPAASSVGNFKGKLYLMQAERNKLSILSHLSHHHLILNTIDLYENAIQSSLDNNFIFEAALSMELLADFYSACQRVTLSQIYLTQAYDMYSKCGLVLRMRQLRTHNPSVDFTTSPGTPIVPIHSSPQLLIHSPQQLVQTPRHSSIGLGGGGGVGTGSVIGGAHLALSGPTQLMQGSASGVTPINDEQAAASLVSLSVPLAGLSTLPIPHTPNYAASTSSASSSSTPSAHSRALGGDSHHLHPPNYTLPPSAVSTGQTNTLTPTQTTVASGSTTLSFDLLSVLKSTLTFTTETNQSKLLKRLMRIVLETGGATVGALVLRDQHQEWCVELSASVDSEEKEMTTSASPSAMMRQSSLIGLSVKNINHTRGSSNPDDTTMTDANHNNNNNPTHALMPHHHHSSSGSKQNLPSSTDLLSAALPVTIFHYVLRTQETVRFADPSHSPEFDAFASDPYFESHSPKALLCLPIMKGGTIFGVLYLENAYHVGAFSGSHIQLLHHLCTQAALSIDNARLYTELSQHNQRLESQVTERTSELEEKNSLLQAAKDEAEKATKVKADFLSNMSHEIRTPMNAVLGVSRLLVDTPLSLEQQQYVQMITNSGHLLLTIINDILDYSKIEAGELKLSMNPYNLLDCVETATQLCYEMAQSKNLYLCWYIDPSTPPVMLIDATRLQQILLNLLSNAIKFTKTGGVELKVMTKAIPQSNSNGPLSINTTTTNNNNSSSPLDASPTPQIYQIDFIVKDTGIGISQAQMSTLFRSFSQVQHSSSEYGGTGLGLVISQKLVQAHGNGTISVESQVGAGSTFTARIHATAVPTPPFVGNPVSPLSRATSNALPVTSSPLTMTSNAARYQNLHNLTEQEVRRLHSSQCVYFGASDTPPTLLLLQLMAYYHMHTQACQTIEEAMTVVRQITMTIGTGTKRDMSGDVCMEIEPNGGEGGTVPAATAVTSSSTSTSTPPSVATPILLIIDVEVNGITEDGIREALCLLNQECTLPPICMLVIYSKNTAMSLPAGLLDSAQVPSTGSSTPQTSGSNPAATTAPTTRRPSIAAPTAVTPSSASSYYPLRPQSPPNAASTTSPSPLLLRRVPHTSTVHHVRAATTHLPSIPFDMPSPSQTNTSPHHPLRLLAGSAPRFVYRRSLRRPFKHAAFMSLCAALLEDGVNLSNADTNSSNAPPNSSPLMHSPMAAFPSSLDLSASLLSSDLLSSSSSSTRGVGGIINESAPSSNSVSSVAAASAHQTQNQAPVKKPKIMNLAKTCPLRILLAEDNLVNQKLMLMIMHKLGYEIIIAANGIEVLEIIEREAARGRQHEIECILMDASMDVMDGMEATRRIRAEQKPTRIRPFIIAQTANVTDGNREQCLAPNMMDCFLPKPIDIDNLASCLRAAFQYQQAQTQANAKILSPPSTAASSAATPMDTTTHMTTLPASSAP